MLKNTKLKIEKYAQTLTPGADRAQCLTIANLIIGNQSIATALKEDHRSADGALRAANLMKDAGCASEEVRKKGCYGTFTFEDGSTLN